jgi:hypothetical protein
VSKPIHDHLGQEIKAGDIIAYPVRRSSTQHLSVSRVLKIEWQTPEYGYRREPFPVLHIAGVSMNWMDEGNTENWVLYYRPVTCLANVLKVHPDYTAGSPFCEWLIDKTGTIAEAE